MFKPERVPQWTDTSLTSAEQEIIELTLLGLSNRELAERRNATVGTIANQLHTACTKLGVRGRRELKAAALFSEDTPRPARRMLAGALTPRQRQIIERADAGQSNKSIAYDLGTSTSTVSTLLTRARRRLTAARC
jgi:DNA-binding CsgD family transcriptional regulator